MFYMLRCSPRENYSWVYSICTAYGNTPFVYLHKMTASLYIIYAGNNAENTGGEKS